MPAASHRAGRATSPRRAECTSVQALSHHTATLADRSLRTLARPTRQTRRQSKSEVHVCSCARPGLAKGWVNMAHVTLDETCLLIHRIHCVQALKPGCASGASSSCHLQGRGCHRHQLSLGETLPSGTGTFPHCRDILGGCSAVRVA